MIIQTKTLKLVKIYPSICEAFEKDLKILVVDLEIITNPI
ncbi:MAG: hypothetical protein RLZZ540_767 [Bacteroidota bacterium]|jgi:hypothetical protein